MQVAGGAGEKADANALRFMQRVRWMGAIFTIVQFALYQPPAGRFAPFDMLPTGLLLAGIMVTLNLVVALAVRNADARRRRQVVLVGLVCDAVVVATLVWLFSFDGTSATWALLVIPVLEAALAAQMVGAVSMWTALTVFYIMRELDTAARYDYAWFEVPSVTFRMGVVLIVAVTAGSLARSLTREAQAQAQAKSMFEHRAGLLHGLAVSSRALFDMEATDVTAVWDAIAQCVLDVGFDGVSISLVEPRDDTYLVVSARGLPDGYVGTRQSRALGLAGMVLEHQRTMVVDDYSAVPSPVPALAAAQFGASLGVPIRGLDGDITAVLIAGYRKRGPIAAAEREYVELLAVHAGVAVSNVLRLVERAQYEQRLTVLAYEDSLTGLPNRARFVERLEAAIAEKSPEHSVSLLFFDIDRFKTVNDSLGHNGGDEVLRTVAARINGCMRPQDLLARLSGDEFAMLLSDVSQPDVEHMVRAILANLGEPLWVAETPLVVTASIGVATTDASPVTAGELLSQADTAMYAAKRAGGASHRWFGPELQEDATRRLRIRLDLQGALARGQLTVVYQPVFNLGERRIVGVEALVRWRHPVLGDIGPTEFIPVAEETDLIIDIGGWVLDQATAQVGAWEASGIARLKLGVNFSARQLTDPRLLERIDAALARADLSAGRLVLEITESVMVEDIESNASVLAALHDRGVGLAVDDFGTGYSSLAYLQRFPVDIVKIDRSFVSRLGDGSKASTLPLAIVQLARTLGMDICAEGIEVPVQLDALVEAGCVYGQGFLLARPSSVDMVTQLLLEQSGRMSSLT